MEKDEAAAKRRRGDKVDLAKAGDYMVESSAEAAKPVYLVAALWAGQPSYPVFMVDPAAVGSGNEPARARILAGLPGAEHGMSFVAAHSNHGSWIVGVGGPGGATIINDPSTLSTLRGPDLSYPKHDPVLISHGGKVYAISRHPRVHCKLNLDFQPWFESLNFKKGVPCILREGCPSWKSLPSPPFFPCLLDPWEFRNPPDIALSSYAAVGSHILLSLQEEEETGTYAFHVVKKMWDKVCHKNLPFVGQAVPLGGSLFAACRIISNNVTAASVFHMSIEVSSTPVAPAKLSTSLMQEFPVAASNRDIPLPLLCPLGKGSFCSIRLGSSRQSRRGNYLKDLQIILTAFQMDNIEAILTACQTQGIAKDLQVAVQVKQHNQTFNFKGTSRFMAPSQQMPIVAAISMDIHTELFEGERGPRKGSYLNSHEGISGIVTKPSTLYVIFWCYQACRT